MTACLNTHLDYALPQSQSFFLISAPHYKLHWLSQKIHHKLAVLLHIHHNLKNRGLWLFFCSFSVNYGLLLLQCGCGQAPFCNWRADLGRMIHTEWAYTMINGAHFYCVCVLEKLWKTKWESRRELIKPWFDSILLSVKVFI